MNKVPVYALVLLFFAQTPVFCGPSAEYTESVPVPFTRGVNFGGWFEYLPKTPQEVSNKFTEQDFMDAKNMGYDAIRLPVDFMLFTSGVPGYKIDPLLFKLIDQAVDLAEKHQLYIILDCHPEAQPEIHRSIRNFLIPVWSQIAEHFKNRSDYLIYEILNEPQAISARDWGKIQGDVVDEIRKIDKKHLIVVGGTDYNSVETLSSLPKYKDNRLLYTFHFYEPLVFTHQGSGDLEDLEGVPFPYRSGSMPAIPNDLKGTWAEKVIANYTYRGNGEETARLIKKASDFSKQRNVPVFCGEFGVLMRFAAADDRVRWYQTVREQFEANKIPWINWAYYDCFGLFNSQLDGIFTWLSIGDINHDLNVDLVKALGLKAPSQRQREQVKTGFTIYDDEFGRGILTFYREENTINMYHTPAAEGQYSIHLGDLRRKGERWDGLTLLFSIVDLTYLVRNGYVLEFKAKREKPFTFNVTFSNLRNGINWDNGFTVDQRHVPADGKWYTVRIPLADMHAWDGRDIVSDEYVNSPGARNASWDKINVMNFLMTQEGGGAYDLYLDSIKITK